MQMMKSKLNAERNSILQLSLGLRGHHICLPIAYRHTLQGLIYHALSANTELADSLHNGGYLTEDRIFKLFTFGPLAGDYAIQDKRIIFHHEVHWEIRSVQPQMIQLLGKVLHKGAAVALGQNAALITHSRIEDRHLQMERAIVTTRSPVVVYQTLENGHTHFLSPTDEGFFPALVRNAQRKWQSLYGTEVPFSLEISPVPGYIDRKVVTSFKGTFITAWNGRFLLRGNPDVIDFLYQVGLGAKSSQGFGMFTVESNGK